MLSPRFVARVAVPFVLALRAAAESHTFAFVNQCANQSSVAKLMYNGQDLLDGSTLYTVNGSFSGIAYLQTGDCNTNGENCTLLETTLINPTNTPGSGSSSDISLIPPHEFNVETSFAYYNGCDGQGKMCSNATCNGDAFFNSNDWDAQVACEVDNVNLLIAFCANASEIVLNGGTGGSGTSQPSTSLNPSTPGSVTPETAVSNTYTSAQTSSPAFVYVPSTSPSSPATESTGAPPSALTPTSNPTSVYVPSTSPSSLATEPTGTPPSGAPTSAPTPTNPSAPTSAPLQAPTQQPTLTSTTPPRCRPRPTSLSPSVAATPSVPPSVAPSVAPSILPSIAASVPPSVAPSIPPSVTASVPPSVAPFVPPTPSSAPSITTTSAPAPSFAGTGSGSGGGDDGDDDTCSVSNNNGYGNGNSDQSTTVSATPPSTPSNALRRRRQNHRRANSHRRIHS